MTTVRPGRLSTMRDLLADIERGLADPAKRGVVANLTELERAIDLHHRKVERELVPLVLRMQTPPTVH